MFVFFIFKHMTNLNCSGKASLTINSVVANNHDLQKNTENFSALFASQGVSGQQGRKNSAALDKHAKQDVTKKPKTSKARNGNFVKKVNNLKHRKQKKHEKIAKGSWAASRAYTCNGTSLGDTCLTNLLNSMKFERDKIRTFTNQKKRAESFKTLIGNKGGKNDQFGNTTTYLLMALGGNMTNFNCSGKASLTTEAAATYT